MLYGKKTNDTKQPEKIYQDIDAKFLGRMLKYRREAARMTQQEAADKIGLSLSYYKNMERGSNNPSIPSLHAALFTYNISSDSVLFPSLEDSNNTTYKQIVRLLDRCSESDLDLILSIITAILSNKDKAPASVQEESVMESYKRAFNETMNKHKSSR